MRLIVFAVAATTRRSCVRGETLKGENPKSATHAGQMSPLCFILASAALVCAAPEGRDTGHGCAVAAACLEKCASDPGGEACARPCHGPPLRPRATKASPADLRVAYFLHHRKAAGTSMLAALKRVAGRVGVEGGSLLVAHEEFRPFNPNLFCSASGASAGVLYVTVLRHPLHRLVSLYHYESNFGDRDPAANRNASAWGAFLDGACARHSGHRPCGNRIYRAFVESPNRPADQHPRSDPAGT